MKDIFFLFGEEEDEEGEISKALKKERVQKKQLLHLSTIKFALTFI